MSSLRNNVYIWPGLEKIEAHYVTHNLQSFYVMNPSSISIFQSTKDTHYIHKSSQI